MRSLVEDTESPTIKYYRTIKLLLLLMFMCLFCRRRSSKSKPAESTDDDVPSVHRARHKKRHSSRGQEVRGQEVDESEV